jgi:hypothetical protein
MAPIRLTRPPGAMVTPAALLRLTLRVPVEVKSELNLRGHWSKRHKRFKEQQGAVAAALYDYRFIAAQLHRSIARGCGVSVTLTRLGGRTLDDDNLRGAFKAVRDSVAYWLLVDDADPRLTFHYSQESGTLIGVRATIEAAE